MAQVLINQKRGDKDMDIRTSVAMAVYNGEKYIKEQVDSILARMGENDELVISYDPSTDATKSIIDEYARKDPRIKILINTNPGVQNNFNNAVMACNGKYIFLSDQDDAWIGDKINVVIEAFEKTGADLVVHDGYMTDANFQPLPRTIFERSGTYNGPIRNIIQCTFWGCCMAFKAELREILCPFPSQNKVGHDLWIGVMTGFYGKIARVDECLMLHRLHGDNVTVTSRRKLSIILRHRLSLIKELRQRARKLRKQKASRRKTL